MRKYFCLTLIAAGISLSAAEPSERWWPVQALPKSVIRTSRNYAGAGRGTDMMLQSAAGLAAKAVNEGRGEELVWVDTGNVDQEDWFARWLAKHPQIKTNTSLGPW